MYDIVSLPASVGGLGPVYNVRHCLVDDMTLGWEKKSRVNSRSVSCRGGGKDTQYPDRHSIPTGVGFPNHVGHLSELYQDVGRSQHHETEPKHHTASWEHHHCVRKRQLVSMLFDNIGTQCAHSRICCDCTLIYLSLCSILSSNTMCLLACLFLRMQLGWQYTLDMWKMWKTNNNQVGPTYVIHFPVMTLEPERTLGVPVDGVVPGMINVPYTLGYWYNIHLLFYHHQLLMTHRQSVFLTDIGRTMTRWAREQWRLHQWWILQDM